MTVSEPHPSYKPGEILLGKYEVVSTLGAGGMGVVMLVRHQQLDELFAVKVLRPQYAAIEHTSSRFLREARAAVKIRSVHGARVLDVGTFPGGNPYMVMEYLMGRDLATWLAQDGPLPADVAVEFTLQSLEALAEAHALGIVHRDIKPANLFVTTLPGGATCVKVLDFGISKASGFTGATPTGNATEPGALMGSPGYMSPEQFSSASTVDARSDIWAVGATMFELLTGEPAFVGETLAQIYAAVVHQPLRSIRILRPELSESLARVVERCLAKDPALRYQNVGELAAALEGQLTVSSSGRARRIGRVVGVSTLRESGLELPAAPPSNDPVERRVLGALSSPSTRRQRRLRGLVAGVLGAAGVLLVLALGRAALSRRTEPLPSASVGLGPLGQDWAERALADQGRRTTPTLGGQRRVVPVSQATGLPTGPAQGLERIGTRSNEAKSSEAKSNEAKSNEALGQGDGPSTAGSLPLTEEDKRRLYGIRQ